GRAVLPPLVSPLLPASPACLAQVEQGAVLIIVKVGLSLWREVLFPQTSQVVLVVERDDIVDKVRHGNVIESGRAVVHPYRCGVLLPKRADRFQAGRHAKQHSALHVCMRTVLPGNLAPLLELPAVVVCNLAKAVGIEEEKACKAIMVA